jgi:hypothetical protein
MFADSITDKHRLGKAWAGEKITVLHIGNYDPSGKRQSAICPRWFEVLLQSGAHLSGELGSTSGGFSVDGESNRIHIHFL